MRGAYYLLRDYHWNYFTHHTNEEFKIKRWDYDIKENALILHGDYIPCKEFDFMRAGLVEIPDDLVDQLSGSNRPALFLYDNEREMADYVIAFIKSDDIFLLYYLAYKAHYCDEVDQLLFQNMRWVICTISQHVIRSDE